MSIIIIISTINNILETEISCYVQKYLEPIQQNRMIDKEAVSERERERANEREREKWFPRKLTQSLMYSIDSVYRLRSLKKNTSHETL